MRAAFAAALTLAAGLAAAALSPQPAAAQRGADEVYHCVSSDFGRTRCPVRRTIAKARLLQQHSRARCIRDVTWGVERRHIWVAQGCRADIAVTYARKAEPPRPPRDDDRRGDGRPRRAEVECVSPSYRTRVCRIPPRMDWIRIARRSSDAACVWGRSWGAAGDELVVSKGCAALFELHDGKREPRGAGWRRILDGGRAGRPGGFDPDYFDEAPFRAPAPLFRPDRPRRPPVAGGVVRGEIFARRAAIRACRRFGEDEPDRFDAFWVEAEPPAEFRAERRGEAWLVQGPFIARRRGQERLIPATCTVLGKTVLRLTIP